MPVQTQGLTFTLGMCNPYRVNIRARVLGKADKAPELMTCAVVSPTSNGSALIMYQAHCETQLWLQC